MKRILPILLVPVLLAVFWKSDDYKDVGDIPFDERIDDSAFHICNENHIKQYYVRRSADVPATYVGEKRALERPFYQQFEPVNKAPFTGYVSIRFIVNCKGEAGRFRVEQMDNDYQQLPTTKSITSQLISIIKGLDGWVPRKHNGEYIDFYQYLTFKFKNGEIVKILP